MKQNFYYADLDWNVDIDDGKSGVFKSMVDVEVHALQLQVWQAISGFLTTRALYLTKPDVTERKKESEKDTVDLPADGG